MLYFENTKEEKEYTMQNCKAVKINYEGEPNFIMEIDGNYKLFLLINEIGHSSVFDLSNEILNDYPWKEIVTYFYDEDEHYQITEYYKDFDITITKRD